MGFLRRSKRNDEPITVGRLDGATGPIKHSKTHSYDIQDPVLTAIRDEEPFQMNANNHVNVQALSPDFQVRDVFGNVISAPDRSNPTRPRDERPLDTIRAFEYMCTGDERLREEMETTRYGWTPRPNFVSNSNFPQFSTNPYAPTSMASAGGYQNSSPNGDPNFVVDPNAQFKIYDPANDKSKKKRGFFGRKKKNWFLVNKRVDDMFNALDGLFFFIDEMKFYIDLKHTRFTMDTLEFLHFFLLSLLKFFIYLCFNSFLKKPFYLSWEIAVWG